MVCPEAVCSLNHLFNLCALPIVYVLAACWQFYDPQFTSEKWLFLQFNIEQNW